MEKRQVVGWISLAFGLFIILFISFRWLYCIIWRLLTNRDTKCTMFYLYLNGQHKARQFGAIQKARLIWTKDNDWLKRQRLTAFHLFGRRGIGANWNFQYMFNLGFSRRRTYFEIPTPPPPWFSSLIEVKSSNQWNLILYYHFFFKLMIVPMPQCQSRVRSHVKSKNKSATGKYAALRKKVCSPYCLCLTSTNPKVDNWSDENYTSMSFNQVIIFYYRV